MGLGPGAKLVTGLVLGDTAALGKTRQKTTKTTTVTSLAVDGIRSILGKVSQSVDPDGDESPYGPAHSPKDAFDRVVQYGATKHGSWRPSRAAWSGS